MIQDIITAKKLERDMLLDSVDTLNKEIDFYENCQPMANSGLFTLLGTITEAKDLTNNHIKIRLTKEPKNNFNNELIDVLVFQTKCLLNNIQKQIVEDYLIQLDGVDRVEILERNFE